MTPGGDAEQNRGRRIQVYSSRGAALPAHTYKSKIYDCTLVAQAGGEATYRPSQWSEDVKDLAGVFLGECPALSHGCTDR
jgi:hypothetical protein